MKKLILLPLVAIALVSCGGGKSAEEVAADSVRIADSIAAAQQAAEQARLDSIAQDSIAKAEAAKMYDNALTVTPGKKSSRPSMYSENIIFTWPVTITNNTTVPISSSDYKVTYTEAIATCSDGSSPDRYSTASTSGPDIAPGESVTVVINSESNGVSNAKAKLKLTREQFEERLSNNGAE